MLIIVFVPFALPQRCTLLCNYGNLSKNRILQVISPFRIYTFHYNYIEIYLSIRSHIRVIQLSRQERSILKDF